MSDVSSLLGRIDAEFSALDEKLKRAQTEQVREQQERQKRLEGFGKLVDQLSNIWRPRFEALAKKFGDRAQVTPRVTPSSREAVFEFQSNLARVRLKFSAWADRDVRNVAFASDLEIVPMLMKYDAHSEREFPLDAVDREALAGWLDDRIISFVHTYLALHENDYYLKEHMVEDPVAHVRFPKFAAAATLEHNGQKYYFASEESRQEFAKKAGIKV
jgi:YHS domain-containing protein